MSVALRIFINDTPLDVEPGTDVRAALRAHDPALEERVAAGVAFVTDARGIEVGEENRLAAGSILRVVVRSRRGGGGGADVDA
jgi:hypothetical protein